MKKMTILSLLFLFATTQIYSSFEALCNDSIKYSEQLIALIQSPSAQKLQKEAKLKEKQDKIEQLKAAGQKRKEERAAQKNQEKSDNRDSNIDQDTANALLHVIQKNITEIKDAEKALEEAKNNLILASNAEQPNIIQKNSLKSIVQSKSAKLSNLKTKNQASFLKDLSEYLTTYGTLYATNKFNTSFMGINAQTMYQYISAKDAITTDIPNSQDLLQAIKDGIMTFGTKPYEDKDANDYSKYTFTQTLTLQLHELKNDIYANAPQLDTMYIEEKCSLINIIDYIERVQSLSKK